MKVITKQDILRKIKEINGLSDFCNYQMGLAGSYARDEAGSDSDIDIVVNTDALTVENIEFIRDMFNPTPVDVLQLKLLEEEDKKMDAFLVSIGAEENEFSIYKSVKEDVIWVDR